MLIEADRFYIVVMYRHLALVSVTILWPLFYALKTPALAILSQGTAITAFNQTQSESTLNITLFEGLSNETFTPSQNFIPYRIPNSPTTLLFHSFGPMIPDMELLQSVTFAVGIVYDYIGEQKGTNPIAKGIFEFSHEFLNGDEVGITVADFREMGRSMTYRVLWDVLRGIGEFALLGNFRELHYEVEVQGIGYLATGHVGYNNTARAA